MNTQDWSPLGWTGWISLQSQGLSRVFSNTTVQKYQFCTQLIILPRGGTRTLLCCCSVAQSCLTLCNPMDCSTPGLPVLHYLMEFAQTHVHTVGDAIQPSHPLIPFSSCLWSFPGAGSFPMSRLFASGGQSIGASTSASVLPMNIQCWSPLGLTRWISLQSKRLSRVFSNTTVQKDSALLLHYCFLTTLPLFMHSLTSLVNTCLNMSLVLREGLEGWSLFFANEKQGTQKVFLYQEGPTGSCSVSEWYHYRLNCVPLKSHLLRS